jgi:hypothetical protein
VQSDLSGQPGERIAVQWPQAQHQASCLKGQYEALVWSDALPYLLKELLHLVF